jgi:Rrf2 family nitric oxide-sensitive transcriptional repressor
VDRLYLAHADLRRRERRKARDNRGDRREFRDFKDASDEGREQARQQGYLDTARGKGGGIKLARSPAEIRVGAIVRETEENLAVMGCFAETGFCRIEGCCVLRHALCQATLAFLQTLDGYTLADLLAPAAQLVASLGLGPELEPAA